LIIKNEIEETGNCFTTILKIITLKKPPDSLFNIPRGYSMANNYMDIIMDQN